MSGQTCKKCMWALYLRPRLNWTVINPLETESLDKILLIFSVYMGMLQALPLFLENSQIPCIIAIFWSKSLLEIKTILNFFIFYLNGIGSKGLLL